ncbi:MAG: energy transducer TonB [Flavobacteriia bacterium]|nr:MAG: energy transducer TonB [Flavobacteriia bacterium]
MEAKKNPKSNLDNFSKLFLLLGLTLALLVAYGAIQMKSYDNGNEEYLAETNKRVIQEEEIPETEHKVEEIKPKNTPPPPPPVLEEIKVVDDDKNIVETVVESTEVTQEEKVVIQEIEEVEIEEEVIEDVPFSVIEDVPVYPGCKGSKEQLKKCFSEKVQKLINKKFNADLANELGLDPGKKRISVMFKIDQKGNITNVRARAPHKRLEAEAIRVVKLLPQMTPGKQRGRPVPVKYALPITFIVQD